MLRWMMNNRLCPYCKNKLVEGFIHSPRIISWLPQKLKLFTTFNLTKDNAIPLSLGTGINAPCVVAYNCTKCNVIIIDYNNMACDYYKRK